MRVTPQKKRDSFGQLMRFSCDTNLDKFVKKLLLGACHTAKKQKKASFGQLMRVLCHRMEKFGQTCEKATFGGRVTPQKKNRKRQFWTADEMKKLGQTCKKAILY